MYAASSGIIAITPLRAADGAAMSTDPTRLDVTPFDVTLFDVTVGVMTAMIVRRPSSDLPSPS